MNIAEVMWEKNVNFLSNTVGNEYWFSYPNRMSGNLESLFSKLNRILTKKP